MHPVKEIVIVGGGIAGSFTAVFSAMFGHGVTVIDYPRPQAASRVAAGLLNPVTGKTANKSWMYDPCFETIVRLTGMPEFRPLLDYIHFTPVYRPATSVHMYNELSVRASSPGWEGLGEMRSHPVSGDQIHNPFGGLWLTKAGWVDVGGLLRGIRHLLTTQFSVRYIDMEVDAPMIHPEKGVIQVNNDLLTFDDLIFTEGVGGLMNDWFPHLPIIPLKGELLTVEIPDLDMDAVLVNGVYVIPRGEQIFTVGSTYEKQFEDDLPSAGGRAELLEKLQAAVRVPARVLDHKAGVRPTTPNRRPLVGSHRFHKNLHVLNGFGTKGILYAPYFAYEMLRSLSFNNNTTDHSIFVSGH